MCKPLGIGELSQMDFSRTAFWVQLHNMPLACMTKKAVHFLGSIFGEVETVDLGEFGSCDGKFLRVHILINIENPLSTEAKVYLEEVRRLVSIVIQYEKLLDFCFHCGRIGDKYSECEELEGQKINPQIFKFGNWLQAKMIAQLRRLHVASGRIFTSSLPYFPSTGGSLGLRDGSGRG
ncbi:hypothetical protein Sjap_005269 [Stephania japonica]|uniref:DUF4283 domain-containing protein n=1 Tax=Stephania japonica TaxID=461633 RepID=A0AAP0K3M7_9MAGN